MSFSDALLAGEIRRDLLAEPRGPSRFLRGYLPRVSRLLSRVDGDAIDREDRVPAPLIREFKRLGLFGLILPKAHGGLGLGQGDYHRVVEAIAAESVGLSMWVTTHQSLGLPALLAASGTPEQRAQYLPRLAGGELSALAMTEAGAGTDPALMSASAVPILGGAAYRLEGRKLWVTNGPVARWVAVLARAPGGITAFIVDARLPGFSLERRCRFLGLRGMENGAIRLKGVVVRASCRIGAEGEGLRLALTAMNAGRLSLVPRALGLARECLRISTRWASSRKQRGEPLVANPWIAERLLRMESLVESLACVGARAAAWAEAGGDLRLESAMAKLFAASTAWETADAALQLRGGRGYETADSQRARGETSEPAERLLRDARGLRLIEGTDDVLRWTIARRGLELARRSRKIGRGSLRNPIDARAAALAAEFRALSRRSGGGVPARAYELADEAVRLFADACRGG